MYFIKGNLPCCVRVSLMSFLMVEDYEVAPQERIWYVAVRLKDGSQLNLGKYNSLEMATHVLESIYEKLNAQEE